MSDMNKIIIGMFDKTGLHGRYAEALDESFKKAGLENVTLQHVDIPLGKLQKDPEFAKRSWEAFKITIPSISAAAKCESSSPSTLLFPVANNCIALGADIPDEVYENLEERFEKEAWEEGMSVRFIIATGQKKA